MCHTKRNVAIHADMELDGDTVADATSAQVVSSRPERAEAFIYGSCAFALAERSLTAYTTQDDALG